MDSLARSMSWIPTGIEPMKQERECVRACMLVGREIEMFELASKSRQTVCVVFEVVRESVLAEGPA